MPQNFLTCDRDQPLLLPPDWRSQTACAIGDTLRITRSARVNWFSCPAGSLSNGWKTFSGSLSIDGNEFPDGV
jgi:hypothetical protein